MINCCTVLHRGLTPPPQKKTNYKITLSRDLEGFETLSEAERVLKAETGAKTEAGSESGPGSGPDRGRGRTKDGRQRGRMVERL